MSRDGLITGECVLCLEELSLSWYEWSHHLLEHTHEHLYYCTECRIGIVDQRDHVGCLDESKINIFGRYDIGGRLDGFVCKLCNYLQINDYSMLEHVYEEHSTNADYETDVARVVLLPDVRPQQHIIPTGFAFIPLTERYRCGVGNCIFHGKNAADYIDHFQKTHSTIKTYYCRHCKKILNRIARPTVPLAEVLQHIDLHSPHMYECFYCSPAYCSTSKEEMQIHLMATHSDLAVKFWHNRRTDGNVIERCELIEIALDCSICGDRIDCKDTAIDHFRTKHSGCQLNFQALKFIKNTTNDAYVTCSVDDSTCYREVFGCGECAENFPDKAKWLGHFHAMHPNGLLTARHHLKCMKSTKDTTTISDQRLMLFSCAACIDLETTPYKATIDGCYEHWKCLHTKSNPKPFQFYAIELVKCIYCNTIATFQDLKEHVAEEHAGKTFVALKAFEYRKICAFCNYVVDGAMDTDAEIENHVQHTRAKHLLAVHSNVANPIPLRDEDLRQILRISVHKQVKCEYCDDVFETKDDYREHHRNEHIKLELMFSHIDGTKTKMQLFGECCNAQIKQSEFFNHLAQHKHLLTCEKCLFETTDAFALVCHQMECHERGSVSLKYRQFMERWYWRSRLIFGNGFVINKFNAIGTQYDTSKEFQQFIDDLIEKKMLNYRGNTSSEMGRINGDDDYADTTTAAAAAAVVIDDESDDDDY